MIIYQHISRRLPPLGGRLSQHEESPAVPCTSRKYGKKNREDRSSGYDAAAERFIAARDQSAVGAATVREWARSLPRGALVLDLGCGHGVPISQTLMDEGLIVYGVDASPALVAAFRRRFPQTPVECSTVERSSFFGLRFDAIVAWGLMFLLQPVTQTALIRKVAGALIPGGQFLFTSPAQACEWSDVLTGLTSVSLGAQGYRRALEDAGLLLEREADDEGENHYYFARKPLVGVRSALPLQEP